MTILGIDPGSSITGFAVIKIDSRRNKTVEDFGCVIAEKHLTEEQKLVYLDKEINFLIKNYSPNIAAVEKLFFFKNLKTAIPVSQSKGVILLALAKKNIPIIEFTPLQVKTAVTGYGRAEKKQLQKMVEILVNLEHLDPKQKFRKKDDAFDAIAVALCASLKRF